MSTAEVGYPITFSGGFLVCPGCGQNFLHHGAVTVYHRSIEDAETSPRRCAPAPAGGTEQRPANRSRNPSERRSGLTIAFECECCDGGFELALAQNKGQILLWWRHNTNSPNLYRRSSTMVGNEVSQASDGAERRSQSLGHADMKPREDFNDDAGQRLMWQLRDMPFRKQLEAAVKLAGRQLEYLKPSLMAMMAGGAVAGPVAEVTRCTIVIVLTNREKVVTIHIPDQPRRTELLSTSLEWDPRQTPFAIDTFVAHWGGAPGEAM